MYASGNPAAVDQVNLSDKVSGFNQHRMIIKKKIDLSDSTLNINNDISSQSEVKRDSSLEKTIGGFLNSFNGRSAMTSAVKFFENVQNKMKNMIPSP